MLFDLLLPTLITTVVLFFLSFLSWMVLGFHAADWQPCPEEDEVQAFFRKSGMKPGNYMFPHMKTNSSDPKAAEAKMKEGPIGVITVFPGVNMGRNLGLTFLHFLVTNVIIAYIATIALQRGSDFVTVFRFIATVAVMSYGAALVQYSIWFRVRITGVILDSLIYGIAAGLIFAALWPKS